MCPSVMWKVSELQIWITHTFFSETYVQAFPLTIQTQLQIIYFENEYWKENSNGLILAKKNPRDIYIYVNLYTYEGKICMQSDM